MKTHYSVFQAFMGLILLLHGCNSPKQLNKDSISIIDSNGATTDSLIKISLKTRPITIPIVRQRGDTLIVYDSLTQRVLHKNNQLLLGGMVVETNFYKSKKPSCFLLSYRYTGSRTKRSCLYHLQYKDFGFVLKDFATFYWGEDNHNQAFGWIVQNMDAACNELYELEKQQEKISCHVTKINSHENEIRYKWESISLRDTMKEGQIRLPIFDNLTKKYSYFSIKNGKLVTNDYDLCLQILLNLYQKP